jgi:4-hydroxybenzoate polyprenyltransferase
MIHISVGEKSITIPKKVTLWTTAELLLIQLRPRQWTKNLLVFAALLFTIDKWNIHYIQASILAFFLFCIISGCVYILNDFVDRHADRQHPEKATRPMASGRLHPGLALSFGAALLTLAFFLALLLNSGFALLLALYFVMNLSYSLKLKHLVIVDLMIIASGFVLRSVAGGFVIGADFTPWFLMCVFLLSLFLAIGKRRHELLLLENDRRAHRKVLASYSETLLNQMSVIVTTLTIMSYSLYTFMSSSTNYLMWTIPCVIYGMFRYLYLIHVLGKGGKPEELLYGDKGILVCLVVFGMAVVVLQQFYVHPN